MSAVETSLIEQGGLLMWPLLVVGAVAFMLFIERTFYLHRGQIRTDAFLSGIRNLVSKRRSIEALTLCEETPGPVAHIVKAALLQYDQDEWRMRSAIQAAALVQIPLLQRRVETMAAIARISSLIGLLGTLTGMWTVFGEYETAGAYAHFGIFVGGFGQAIITTVTGLSIAILAYAAYHFLQGRVRALVHDMEYVGNDMMQFLLRDLPDEENEIDPLPQKNNLQRP